MGAHAHQCHPIKLSSNETVIQSDCHPMKLTSNQIARPDGQARDAEGRQPVHALAVAGGLSVRRQCSVI